MENYTWVELRKSKFKRLLEVFYSSGGDAMNILVEMDDEILRLLKILINGIEFDEAENI